MPNYVYRCDCCQQEIEKWQPVKEDPLKKCPACGQDELRRVITGGAGFILRGGGYYSKENRRT